MKKHQGNKVTIFSKNRITIVQEKLDSPNPQAYVYSKFGLDGSLHVGDTRLQAKEIKTKTIGTTTTIRCESPLGFYYWKQKTTYSEVQYTNPSSSHQSVGFNEVTLAGKRNTYTLIYPVSQGEVVISTETRPWQIICGYKSMPDHFVSDLFSDLEDIFSELQHDKAVVMTKTTEFDWTTRDYKFESTKTGLSEFKNKLYLEVFGNPKGPIEMTNTEKILAHGFDLKTSFRKDPEK